MGLCFLEQQSQKTYTISHHKDLDGVVSATLLYDYLIKGRGCSPLSVRLVCVDYEDLVDWREQDFSDTEHWVLDFEDHPDSDFWFDHHSGRVPCLSSRNKPSRVLLVSPRSKSCSSLLYTKLFDFFGYQNEAFHELVSWTDTIDSASYSSPGDVTRLDHPVLKLNLLLQDRNIPNDVVRDIVYLLFSFQGDCSLVMESSKIHNLYEEARVKRDLGFDILRKHSKIYNVSDGLIRVLVCIIPDLSQVIISSLYIFSLFPTVNYVIFCQKLEDGRTKVHMARSPFVPRDSDFDIGKFLKKEFSGGGHRDAGGFVLPKEKVRSVGLEPTISILLGKISNLLDISSSVNSYVGNFV